MTTPAVVPPAILPPAILLTSQIVFQTSSHWYIYCIKANRWLIENTSQKVQADGSLVINNLTDLRLYSNADDPDITHNLTTVDAVVSDSASVACIGKLIMGTVRMFLVLVPLPSGTSTAPGARLLFLRASRGRNLPTAARRRIAQRYNNFSKRSFDYPGTQLFDGAQLLFLRKHSVLISLAGTQHQLRRGPFRARIWSSHTHGLPVLEGAHRPSSVTHGQVVQLHEQAAIRLTQQVKQEMIRQRVNYRGGKSHASQRPFYLSDDPAARRAALYETALVPINDFYLSQQPDNFQAVYAAEDIVHAVHAIREEAAKDPRCMPAAEIDQLVQALSSSLYESIGWKLDPAPPVVSTASLSDMSVDIDQVVRSLLLQCGACSHFFSLC
jgi:hypothetical protein